MIVSAVNSTGLQEVAIPPITRHSINLILAIPINGYVVWLIVTGVGETMTNEFFALNLAVSSVVSSLSHVFGIISYYLSAEPL